MKGLLFKYATNFLVFAIRITTSPPRAHPVVDFYYPIHSTYVHFTIHFCSFFPLSLPIANWLRFPSNENWKIKSCSASNTQKVVRFARVSYGNRFRFDVERIHIFSDRNAQEKHNSKYFATHELWSGSKIHWMFMDIRLRLGSGYFVPSFDW